MYDVRKARLIPKHPRRQAVTAVVFMTSSLARRGTYTCETDQQAGFVVERSGCAGQGRLKVTTVFKTGQGVKGHCCKVALRVSPQPASLMNLGLKTHTWNCTVLYCRQKDKSQHTPVTSACLKTWIKKKNSNLSFANFSDTSQKMAKMLLIRPGRVTSRLPH